VTSGLLVHTCLARARTPTHLSNAPDTFIGERLDDLAGPVHFRENRQRVGGDGGEIQRRWLSRAASAMLPTRRRATGGMEERWPRDRSSEDGDVEIVLQKEADCSSADVARSAGDEEVLGHT